ncbi:uracil-DNA glycosylase family protein [Leptospira weilii serovar Ranarum str. ICFT]|uniref:Uracil-DNA glycosylase family protein n=1 Tax=Leptospira weilii serovar Ranarum str. ICFT TaxID=1218598 RepID=N1WBX0_9LEPT|nr:uracil-DNA glycosylase family protein [Leptospira weilii]EMY76410.1 uracil-DNA glycosylase family protein [Leptospira weilii serovar Ranarum str. ICFT]
MQEIESLLKKARSCSLCAKNLPFPSKPIFRVNPMARILLIGQAPGLKVHESGIPWQDASGERLRAWMGLSADTFYDEQIVAIMPMGFCYPGKGKSGDLPPRPECAPEWHPRLLPLMPNIRLTILIGQYAQERYLLKKKANLTETVKAFREYAPQYLPLVHPSPRNQIWLKRNPWFEKQLVPDLQKRIQALL